VTFLVTVVVELQRNIFKVSLEYLAVRFVSWCDKGDGEGSICDLICIIKAEFSLWLTFTISDLLLLEHENRSVICAV